MLMIYYRAVQKGLRTIEDIPEKYREEVKRLLKGGA